MLLLCSISLKEDYSRFHRYYRGRIIKGPSERGVVNVFYVDYGYEAEVDTTDIYSLVEKYMWRLPFQAIACSLADVIPIDESKGWSKEAADCMWDETSTEDGMVKEFVIKVNQHYLKCYFLF